MSELRRDPGTREWVIIATDRAARPHSFRAPPRPRSTSHEGCPFCPGRESETPPEVLVYPQDGAWRVRVVPNLYPALTPGSSTERRIVDGHFMAMDGVGAHEVVIETPDHDRPIALMSDEEVLDVLRAYQERYLALKEDPSVRFVVIFKNHGPRAGTSLEHPHSQIVATPIAPPLIRRRFEIATEHYDARGRCLYCDKMDWEREAGKRVVMENDGFLVVHPYASRSPFETLILPKNFQPCFASVEQDELRELAIILRTTLRKIYHALGDPDFNYIVHTAPVEDEQKHYFLWHIEIVPRLTTVAGFEMGSGIYINTALPEETARFMRELPDD
jgi:UDPglucose--hexose-1-phosphate uridylyltransferase